AFAEVQERGPAEAQERDLARAPLHAEPCGFAGHERNIVLRCQTWRPERLPPLLVPGNAQRARTLVGPVKRGPKNPGQTLSPVHGGEWPTSPETVRVRLSATNRPISHRRRETAPPSSSSDSRSSSPPSNGGTSQVP